MIITNEDQLTKKIKKNIYGKNQNIKITFPPGFSMVALEESKFILENTWFQKKGLNILSLSNNEIRVNDIHMFSIIELLMRNQCFSDIRLICVEGKTFGKNAFEKKCKSIPWDFYLDKTMSVKINVKSIASNAFHESGLREILSNILQEKNIEIVRGENANETTSIYVDFYKNRLTLSISLAGSPLYKRGYRGVLSSSAPLREDAAFCCIHNAFKFAKLIDPQFTPNSIFIPFSGTGTFAFEYIQSFFNFAPVLFDREYALKKMPLFRRDNFNYLLKKAIENCIFPKYQDEENLSIHFVCVDNSKNANLALMENIDIFKKAMNKYNFNFPRNLFINENQMPSTKNFFEMDMNQLVSNKIIFGNVFILLNPPYGIRLGKRFDPILFYKNIAKKINELSSLIKQKKSNLLGFILCPSEETWSVFYHTLIQAKKETYHFTQGGIDVRVCQFFI